jgi:hypothetical protein
MNRRTIAVLGLFLAILVSGCTQNQQVPTEKTEASDFSFTGVKWGTGFYNTSTCSANDCREIEVTYKCNTHLYLEKYLNDIKIPETYYGNSKIYECENETDSVTTIYPLHQQSFLSGINDINTDKTFGSRDTSKQYILKICFSRNTEPSQDSSSGVILSNPICDTIQLQPFECKNLNETCSVSSDCCGWEVYCCDDFCAAKIGEHMTRTCYNIT